MADVSDQWTSVMASSMPPMVVMMDADAAVAAVNATLKFEEYISIAAVLFATGLFFGIWQLLGLLTYLSFPLVLWKSAIVPEIVLLLIDLFVAALHPFFGACAVLNEWIWGPYGCQAYAFSSFLFYTFQLLLVPYAAIIRCVDVSRKPGQKKLSPKCVWSFVIILFLLALFFATAPLAGFAKYAPVPMRIVCTLDWMRPDDYLKIYSLAYLCAVIGVPFLAAVIADIITFVKIKRDEISVEWAPEGKEGRVIIGRLLSIYVAFASYIVVIAWSIFDRPSNIPRQVNILPPIAIKLGGFLHLIFYFWLNPKLLACLRKGCGCSYDAAYVVESKVIVGSAECYKVPPEDGARNDDPTQTQLKTPLISQPIPRGQAADYQRGGRKEDVDFADND